MALSLVGVGAKVTAAITNGIINLTNLQGLTSVIPTAVAGTGVSVGARGKVTFTNTATNIDLQGVFTNLYDDYLIVVHARTSSTTVSFQLLDATNTALTTATYDVQLMGASSTSAIIAQGLGATSWNVGATTATIQDIKVDLFSPFLAAETTGLGLALGTPNPMTTAAAISQRGLMNRNALSYAGLRVFLAAAGPIGSVRVYGYNPN